ncbi:WxL domain-containing protein [Lactococcus petauri]|uniref:WxL domain-containing protein n=1 Tax=Lactococcus petauri TaxID=1940789 RepID=UPI0032648CCC
MKKKFKLGITLGILSLLSFEGLSLKSLQVEAAMESIGILVPGQTTDTGNHVLDSTFQRDKNNWITLAGNPTWWKWDLTGNNYFWLANSKQSSWVYHMMDASIDFSQPVHISTPYSYINASKEWGWGDAAGFILTPSSNEQIQANAPGAAGQGLGINGLYNTIFMGRDLYYNPNFDGPSNSSNDKGIDTLEIRKTNVSGNLEASSAATIPWVQSKAPMDLQHDGGLLFPSNYRGGEKLEVDWTDIKTNTSGTYTGTLTVSSTPDSEFNNKGKYGKVSTSRVLTLQKNMSFGSIGVTGSNTGVIKEGNATSEATFSAMRGTANVTVNYMDSTTNKPIKNVASSTIKGNTGEYVGVESSISLYYDYSAPNIKNYNLSKGDYLKISNSKANVLNVYYTPKSETATFKTYYTKGTPGTGDVTDSVTGLIGGSPESTVSIVPGKASALPASMTLSGNYEGAIGSAPDLNIPEGYEVDYVVGPDGQGGKTYPDLASALAANPNFDDISNNAWANYFSIYLKAKEASTNFTYKYVEGTRPNAPILAGPLTQKGVIGGIVKDPTKDLSALPTGATIQNVTGPDGKNYDTLSDAIASENNKYFMSGPSNFLINVIAPPVSVTIDNTPDLDFGTQELQGKPIYDMIPKKPLIVTDDTATNKGWRVTANLVQQFTTDSGETIKDATMTFSKTKVTPGAGNVAAAPTAFDFILSEDEPVLVSSAQVGTGQGQWQLQFPEVSLNTYGSSLKINQSYQATVEWSISNTP